MRRLITQLCRSQTMELRAAFSQLQHHMASQKADSEQMMSTIRMFETSRPQNLLLFSKVFLALNTDRKYVTQPAICSTTLQKYVLDKWVNLMPKLRHRNQ